MNVLIGCVLALGSVPLLWLTQAKRARTLARAVAPRRR